MISKDISSRIATVRLPLIFGVVLIHNSSTTAHLDSAAGSGSLWLRLAHLGISEGAARVAVPLFYLISGYLFFTGFQNLDDYREKLGKRIWTLLIPFLFWNLAALFVYGVGESLGGTAQLFSSASRFYVPKFRTFDYFNALIGITGPPIAYQFWFIRDLMALVILAPSLQLVFRRRLGALFVLFLFGLWFVNIWPLPWPKIESTLYFSLGAYFSYASVDLTSVDRAWRWVGLVFATALCANVLWFETVVGPYVHRSMVISGVVFSWWVMGMIVSRAPRLASVLRTLGASSFFVFAAHEPLLTICWKLTLKLLGHRAGAAFFALYILIPTALTMFLVILHRVMQRMMPAFTGVISGERREAQTRTAPSPSC